MEYTCGNMELLESVMTLIAEHMGNNCEVVLHDFTKGSERTIVSVRNGHVTGREIGGCATNLGLEVMQGTLPAKDNFNYISYAPNGHVLRSSSVFFHDSNGSPLGSLCVNLDITDTIYFEKFLRDFNHFHEIQDSDRKTREIFTPNVNDLLDTLIEQCVDKYGKSPKLLTKEEKMQFIAELDGKGAFVITKSSDKICGLMGISRYTFYNYLDTVRKTVENK